MNTDPRPRRPLDGSSVQVVAQHILVVEDDPTIWRGLHQALGNQGYDVSLAANGAEALRSIDTHPDLILLDLGLPDMDGIEVCRRVRANYPQATILILTARSDEIDVVLGLDAGADDYLTKPFKLSELLARIRAHLRRQVPDSEQATIVVDELTIDLAAHRVLIGDVEIELRPKEFDLLTILASDAGKAINRDEIMRVVWDSNWHGPTKTLDQHISSLRKHLGGTGDHIVTVRGVGYRYDRS